MEFLSSYGLFVAKIVTVVIAIILISMVILVLRCVNRTKGDLKLIDLSEAYRERQREMQQVKMSDAEYKVWLKPIRNNEN